MEEWLGELDKHFIHSPPANYYTRQTYQQYWKCGETTAKNRLRDLMKAGKIKVIVCSVETITGRKLIPHYGPPNPTKQA